MKLQLYSLEEVVEKLDGLNLKEVERATGISYPTIYSLSKGQHKDYRLSTLVAITEFFEVKDAVEEVIKQW
jgi:hypothetical protein